jgi:hypothetical protein
MSRKKAWRWFFAVGLGSGGLGMGADAEPPADSPEDAPGVVVETQDRHGQRVDRLVADLLGAFADGPEALDATTPSIAGVDEPMGRYLRQCRQTIGPIDVHAVRHVGEGLVLVTARSEADGSWHQLALGVTPDAAVRFVRVDPLRY